MYVSNMEYSLRSSAYSLQTQFTSLNELAMSFMNSANKNGTGDYSQW